MDAAVIPSQSMFQGGCNISVAKSPLELQAECRDELCKIYAQTLIAAGVNDELLRYFKLSKDGDEWRAIEEEFYDRFGDKKLPRGSLHAEAHFKGALGIALGNACVKAGLAV